MAYVSFAHTLLFMIMFAMNTLFLFLAFKAKRMITGYRAEFLNAVIYSFLIFSVAIIFHFLREVVLDIPDLVLLEHSFILLSLACLLCTGLLAMRNRSEWGIP